MLGRMRRPVRIVALAVALCVLLAIVAIPASGAAGNTSHSASGPDGQTGAKTLNWFNVDAVPGSQYLDAPDSPEKAAFLAEHPKTAEFIEQVEELRSTTPAEKLPASLRPRDPNAVTPAGEKKSGAGTGGWNPIAQSNSVVPGNDYDVITWQNTTVDTSGNLHLFYLAGFEMNDPAGLDPWGTTQTLWDHQGIYHAVYSNGVWSEPQEIVSVGNWETAGAIGGIADTNGEIHYFYYKYKWTSTPYVSPGGAGQPPAGTYNIHEQSDYNLFYTYWSPAENKWMSARQLTDNSGLSQGLGAAIHVWPNRIYATWYQSHNLNDGAYTLSHGGNFAQQQRVCATDGMRGEWKGVRTLKSYTFDDSIYGMVPDGNERIPFMWWPNLFTGNGGMTVAWPTDQPWPGVDANNTGRFNAASMSRSGEWTGPDVIGGPTLNKFWDAFDVQGWYLPMSDTCHVFARQLDQYWYSVSTTATNIARFPGGGTQQISERADIPPNGNYFMYQHDSSGWKSTQMTNAVPGQVVDDLDLTGDPVTGWCKGSYVLWQYKWLFHQQQQFAGDPDPTHGYSSWGYTPFDPDPGGGQALCTVVETATGFENGNVGGGPSDFKNVFCKSGGSEVAMDRNGALHNLFTNYDTVITQSPVFPTFAFTATDQNFKVLYSTDARAGAGLSEPVQLGDFSNEIVIMALSCNPAGGVLATWFNWKLSPGTGAQTVGDVHSRYSTGGTWSDDKTVSSGIATVVSMGGNWLGDQRLYFAEEQYDPGTDTDYGFKAYYRETVGGTWTNPQLVTNDEFFTAAGNLPMISTDANNRVFLLWETGAQDTLYVTSQKAPTPMAKTFYFAEGTSRMDATKSTFNEWICLQNPGDSEANVTITYMLGTGENKEQKVVVAPHSRFTVDVGLAVGAGQDISARVSSDQLIVAERPMYFDYYKWTGGHDVIGSMDTERVWYFAEGTTRTSPNKFGEYITIQNPSGIDTTVDLTYMLGDGSTKQQTVTVAKRSRFTVDVNAAVGPEQDVSTMLVSRDAAVVAERPMYFNYSGDSGKTWWDGGHDVMGSTNLFNRMFFAEGTTRHNANDGNFDTYLCIQNPNNSDGKATITYIMGDGTSKTEERALKATSRTTVKVNDVVGNDKDVSIVVDSEMPILAERPMYFDYRNKWTGGHVQTGTAGPKNAWFFAEGTTRDNKNDGQFEEWLSIVNPDVKDANVTFNYMLGDGSVVKKTMVVGKKSRATVDVNLVLGKDKDVSVEVWSDIGVIVERPMYFNYRDKWTGGHDVVGL